MHFNSHNFRRKVALITLCAGIVLVHYGPCVANTLLILLHTLQSTSQVAVLTLQGSSLVLHSCGNLKLIFSSVGWNWLIWLARESLSLLVVELLLDKLKFLFQS